MQQSVTQSEGAGYEFWLFPNLLSDQVDLVGAFKPLYSLGKPADGKSHLGTRIGGFVGVAFMLYVFYVYTPDEQAIGKGFENANDSILGMFEGGPKKSIGPGSEYVQPKFGSDRNMDIDKIRQNILLEKQRKREEAQRRKADGLPEEEPQIVIPSLSEVYEEEANEAEEEAAASATDGGGAEQAGAAGQAGAQGEATAPEGVRAGGDAEATADGTVNTDL